MEETPVRTTSKPLSKEKTLSKFSITAALSRTEKEEEKDVDNDGEENLPTNHFTETDLQNEWQKFLQKIKSDDPVVYNATNGFRLSKYDENTIRIHYPSESAKLEFEKVRADFFNHFMHRVNNFSIKVEYIMDTALKKEILTKRKIFEKMIEKNPLLKDLDDLMKFDLS